MAMVRHPGSTGIVPLFDDGTVVMVSQYRHPIGDYLLEIPAGTMGHGESPLSCASRELEEEVGLFVFICLPCEMPALWNFRRLAEPPAEDSTGRAYFSGVWVCG